MSEKVPLSREAVIALCFFPSEQAVCGKCPKSQVRDCYHTEPCPEWWVWYLEQEEEKSD